MSALPTRLRSALDRLRLGREPILYLALAVGVVLTAVRLLQGETPLDIFGEDYLDYTVGALVALVARQSVYAPATVRADESAFVDVDPATMVDPEDPDGDFEDLEDGQ